MRTAGLQDQECVLRATVVVMRHDKMPVKGINNFLLACSTIFGELACLDLCDYRSNTGSENKPLYSRSFLESIIIVSCMIHPPKKVKSNEKKISSQGKPPLSR